jgi:hypothetical protein
LVYGKSPKYLRQFSKLEFESFSTILEKLPKEV